MPTATLGGEKGWAERKEETAEELEKQKAGQQRAEEREIVTRGCQEGMCIWLEVKGQAGNCERRDSELYKLER